MDPALSEREIAELLGYSRVWDSGQLRFTMRLGGVEAR